MRAAIAEADEHLGILSELFRRLLRLRGKAKRKENSAKRRRRNYLIMTFLLFRPWIRVRIKLFANTTIEYRRKSIKITI